MSDDADSRRPELVAQPDVLNNGVDAHNSWMVSTLTNTPGQTRPNYLQADGMLPYIDWAVENGFGVIDINIPNHNHQEVRRFHPLHPLHAQSSTDTPVP